VTAEELGQCGGVVVGEFEVGEVGVVVVLYAHEQGVLLAGGGLGPGQRQRH